MVSHTMVVSSPVASPAMQPVPTISKLTLSPNYGPSGELQGLFEYGKQRNDVSDDEFAEEYALVLQLVAKRAVIRSKCTKARLAAMRTTNAALRTAKFEEDASTRRKCSSDVKPRDTTAASSPGTSNCA